MVTCASKYIKFIDIGVPEREESEKGIEKKYVNNSWKLNKSDEKQLHIQKVQWSPSLINSKRSTLR